MIQEDLSSGKGTIKNYISLQEASKFCSYSQEYLSLRARHGKLKSVKFGRNWVTTKEWLEEYLIHNGNGNGKLVSTAVEPLDAALRKPPENLPVGEPSFPKKIREVSFGNLRPAFAAVLTFVLLTGTAAFGKDGLRNVYKEIAPAVRLVFKSQLEPIVNDLKISEIDLTPDVSSILKTIGSQDIWMGNISVTIEETIKVSWLALRDYSGWAAEKITGNFLTKGLTEGYGRADQFLEKRFIEDAGKLSAFWGGTSEKITEKYFTLNDSLEKKLISSGQNIKGDYLAVGNFVKEKISEGPRFIAQAFKGAYRFVTAPIKRIIRGGGSLIGFVGKEEFEKLKSKMEEFEKEPVVIKRIEVEKVVEPIKEITREVEHVQKITKVDERALAQVKGDIESLWSEVGKRLYAPGGVVSQTIFVKEPIQSPKIYQENGEIVFQTLGSGNVILSAATGLQLYGQQVVIESTNLLNPMIYLADKTRIGGDLTTTGSITGGALAVSSINASGAATVEGNLTVSGGLTVSGAQTFSGANAITASSTPAALSVTQTGTGDILNLNDGSTEVFTVLDGGNVGIATTTPGTTLSVSKSGNNDILSVNNSTTGDIMVIKNSGNIGIATTTPEAKLTVSQSGTGDIVNFWDGSVSVFSVADGGNVSVSKINSIIYVDGKKYPADGAGIQRAINDLPSTGGKVIIPAGTYTVGESTQLDSADTAWTASTNVTATADTANPLEGTASARLAIADAFTTGLIAYYNITSINIASTSNIYFDLKASTTAISAGVLQFVLDDTSGCSSPLKTIDLVLDTTYTKVWGTSGGDNNSSPTFVLNLGDASSLTNVACIGLQAASDPGATTIHIDDIRAAKGPILVQKNNVSLIGTGRETIIRLADNVNHSQIYIGASDTVQYQGMEVKSLAINGNYSSQTQYAVKGISQSSGILAYNARDVVIEDILATEVYQYGISFEGCADCKILDSSSEGYIGDDGVSISKIADGTNNRRSHGVVVNNGVYQSGQTVAGTSSCIEIEDGVYEIVVDGNVCTVGAGDSKGITVKNHNATDPRTRNVVVSNNLVKATSSSAAGIYVRDGGNTVNGLSGIVITGNKVIGTTNATSGSYGSIYLGYVQDSVVSNNSISGGFVGVEAQNSLGIIIEGNHIASTSNDGIRVGKEKSQVLGNYIKEAGQNGIDVNGATDTIIKGNQISTSTNHGINLVAGGSRLSVIGNEVYGSASSGIYFNSNPQSKISENTVYNSKGTAGIWVKSSEVEITGNVSSNNTNRGIYLYNDSGTISNIRVANNTANNAQAASMSGLLLACSSGTSIHNVEIIGNTFTDTQSTKTQNWGINLASCSYNNIRILNNNLSGNITAGISNPKNAVLEAGNLMADAGPGFSIAISSTTATTTALTVTQSGTGDILNLIDGARGVFTVLDGGNVGIATTTPRYTLDVWGDMAVGTSTGSIIPMNYPIFYVNSGEGGSSNGVGIGTTTLAGLFTVGTSTPAFSITSAGNVSIGTMQRYTNASIPALYVDSGAGGRIGIGTTTLAGLLTVGTSTPALMVNQTGNVFAYGGLYQDIYGSDDGLVLYLPFPEGMTSSTATTTYDRSPYGNDGALTFMATTTPSTWVTSTDSVGGVPCKAGTCLSFDGTDDHVRVSDSSSLDITGAITMEAWTYNTRSLGGSSYDQIFGKNMDNTYAVFWTQDGGILTFRLKLDGTARNLNSITPISVNSWQHWVFTYDGSQMKIFLNGGLDASASFSGSINTNDNYFGVGKVSDRDFFFRGLIDEVRVYNRALGANEIRTHYLRGANANGTVLANKFRVVNTTNNITFQIDGSGNTTFSQANATATFVGNIKVSDDKWLGLGENEGRIVFDNQSTDYLNILNANVGIATTTPRYALDVWGDMAVGTTTGTGAGTQYPLLFVNSEGGGVSGGIGVGIGTTTLAGLFTVGTTTARLVVDPLGNVGIASSTPSAVFAVQGNIIGSGNVNFYGASATTTIGGGLVVGTSTLWAPAGGYVGIGTTTPKMALDVYGNIYISSSTGVLYQPMYGSDDGLVFHMPFSEGMTSSSAEIARDYSIFGNDGTATNMPMPARNATSGESGWATTTCKTGSCMSFDSTDDYVTMGDPSDGSLDFGSNSFSVELWTKISPTTNGNPNQYLFYKGGDSISVAGYAMYTRESNADFCFIMSDGDGSGTDGPCSTGNNKDIRDNNWHYIVAVVDKSASSIIRLYIDGLANATDAITEGNVDSTRSLHIGSQNNGFRPANGLIDEVKIYKRTLSTEEIRTHYLRGTQTFGTVLANKFRVVNATNTITFQIDGSGNTTFSQANATATFAGNIKVSDDKWLGLGENEGRIVFDNQSTDYLNILNVNVGIATTTPRYKLDVWGDMAVGTSTQSGGINVPALYVDSGDGGRIGIGTTTLAGLLTVGTTTARLVVDPLGNVGIASSTPSDTFAVQGNIIGSGNLTLYGTVTSTIKHGLIVDTNTLYVAAEANMVGIGMVPTYLLDVNGTGRFTQLNIGSGGGFVNYTSSPNRFRFGDVGGNGIEVAFHASAAERVRINATGFGIATTTSRAKLDVWGDIAIGTSTAGKYGDLSGTTTPAFYVKSGDGGQVGIGTTTLSTNLLTVGTTTPALVVANNGFVGIGTTAPTDALHVVGDILTTACASDGAGDVACFDVAENYPVSEMIEAGDVVSAAGENSQLRKSQTAYEKSIIGVVSTKPALLIEEERARFGAPKLAGVYEAGTQAPVALAGRVPVKVSLENGPVAVGDALTSASIPGAAMRATAAGRVIGIALESFDENSSSTDGIGKVMVFINPHWQGGDLSIQENSNGQIVQIDIKSELASIGLVVNEYGVLEVGKLKTQELCVGAVCVTEADFMRVFGASAGETILGGSTSQISENQEVEPQNISSTSTSDVSSSTSDVIVPDLPDSVIDLSPEATTTSTEAAFEFHSTKENSVFICQIDAEFWNGCESPKIYTGLSAGFHQFQVQAIDAQNHEEPSPSIFKWEIIPQTIIEASTSTETIIETTTIETTTTTDEIATSTPQ